MQARYGAEERLADAIATRWGFGNEIKASRGERQRTVNPILELLLPEISRRRSARIRRRQEALRAKFRELLPKGE